MALRASLLHHYIIRSHYNEQMHMAVEVDDPIFITKEIDFTFFSMVLYTFDIF